jgi:hypothetical protein
MTSVILDIIARDHFSAQFIKAGAEMEGLAKKATKSTSGINKALKATAVIGAAAVVTLVAGSVVLASKFEDSQKRLEAALKGAGSSFEELKGPIAAANKNMEKLGFTNTQTADALANLTVATKNPEKSLKLLGLAADLARFKHVDLATAATAVGKAMAGNLKPIKQLGIDLPVAASSALKVATATEKLRTAQDTYNTALAIYQKTPTAANMAKMQTASANLKAAQEKLNTTTGASNIILKTLQERLGGQAQAAASTLAGKTEVLRARLEDVGIKIGTVLIPPLIKLVGWVSTVADFFQRHAALAKTLAAILGGVLVVAIGHVVAAWLAANLEFATTPIGAIITAAALLAVGITLLALRWSKGWAQISSDVAKAGAFIRRWWFLIMSIPVIGWLLVIAANWKSIWSKMQTAVRDFTGAMQAVWRALTSAWDNTYQAIVNTGTAIINWFRRLPQFFYNVSKSAGQWLVEGGKNIIRGLWNGIVALATWFKNKVLSFIPKWIRDALHLASPPPWAIDIGSWIAKGIAQGITKLPHFMGNLAKMARDRLAAVAKAGAGAAGDLLKMGGTLQGVTGYGDLNAWIAQAIALTGVPANWAPALWRRAWYESSGNPNAINLTDQNAAAGHPSQGLMQTIPNTFAHYHQPGTSWNIYDPVANIAAAINYIRSRYGTIWNIDPPVSGYAAGAWNVPYNQLAFLHAREMVIPAPAAEKFRGGDFGGVTVQPGAISVYAAAGMDEGKVAAQAFEQLRAWVDDERRRAAKGGRA